VSLLGAWRDERLRRLEAGDPLRERRVVGEQAAEAPGRRRVRCHPAQVEERGSVARYAEGFGDVFGPQWAYDPGDNNQPRPVKDMQLSTADKAAVDRVCAAAKRCAIVVVSGRPLILDSAQRDAADAIVAAWLPGSEGAGVADTLFGARPFTGKLSFTWPKTLDQEPINVGDRRYDPLYPFGWGLTTGR
jgi:beta-glucosidase